jgi:hypothetical protein
MKHAVLLPCRHIFHEECIRQWIIKNLNHFCPKCKQEFNFNNAPPQPHPQPQPQPEQQQEQQGIPQAKHLLQNIRQLHPNANRMKEEYQEKEEFLEGEEGLEGIEDWEQSAENERERPQQKRRVKGRQYVIERPEVGSYPLEVYESMRKQVLAVGSLPYGLPSVAVTNRSAAHMQLRNHYAQDMEVILRLLNMNRN